MMKMKVKYIVIKKINDENESEVYCYKKDK